MIVQLFYFNLSLLQIQLHRGNIIQEQRRSFFYSVALFDIGFCNGFRGVRLNFFGFLCFCDTAVTQGGQVWVGSVQLCNRADIDRCGRFCFCCFAVMQPDSAASSGKHNNGSNQRNDFFRCLHVPIPLWFLFFGCCMESTTPKV